MLYFPYMVVTLSTWLHLKSTKTLTAEHVGEGNFLINSFSYLHPKCYPRHPPPRAFHPIPSTLWLWKGDPSQVSPICREWSVYRIRHIHSHWRQKRQSSTTHAQAASDQSIYLSTLVGGLVDTVDLLTGFLLHSAPSPNSSIEVPNLSAMVGCKYLHLSQSAAGGA